jgi:cell wall-associated NlpC family hydrolase
MNQGIRDALIEVALSHLFKPYTWGGNGPDSFDCSGYVIACLSKIGRWPVGVDDTAHGIYNRFKRYTTETPYRGNLVFWGSTERIHHIAIILNNRAVIGAHGRDIRKVTVEPIDYRIKRYNLSDFVAYCDPLPGVA